MAKLRDLAPFFYKKKPDLVQMHTAAGLTPLFFPALLVFFLFSSLPLWAFPGDTDVLTAELWAELDPIPLTGESLPVTQEAAIARTLEEARLVISGMIYGYEVTYTPSDRERRVAEQLEVVPRAEIPAGDPALRAMNVRIDSNKYYVQVRYDLADFQIRHLGAWNSNILESAAGRGTAPLQDGYRGKFESFNQGIKNALRDYLRKRVGNKPRKITARVVLQAPPYTTIDAGGYHSLVRVRIDLRDVQPYGAY